MDPNVPLPPLQPQPRDPLSLGQSRWGLQQLFRALRCPISKSKEAAVLSAGKGPQMEGQLFQEASWPETFPRPWHPRSTFGPRGTCSQPLGQLPFMAPPLGPLASSPSSAWPPSEATATSLPIGSVPQLGGTPPPGSLLKVSGREGGSQVS